MTLNLILGAGGFAREVGLVYADAGRRVDGYLSDDPAQKDAEYEFAQCLGSIESIVCDTARFTPGIGAPGLRMKLVERALARGWQPSTIVSPKANVPAAEARVKIGVGSVVCAGVSITVNVSIGAYVNVNLNCTLGHDCVIGDFVNLSPAVNVSGNAQLGPHADIGTGAVILPHIRIGSGAIIGARAVVTRDVPSGEVWAGVPARFVKGV